MSRVAQVERPIQNNPATFHELPKSRKYGDVLLAGDHAEAAQTVRRGIAQLPTESARRTAAAWATFLESKAKM